MYFGPFTKPSGDGKTRRVGLSGAVSSLVFAAYKSATLAITRVTTSVIATVLGREECRAGDTTSPTGCLFRARVAPDREVGREPPIGT
jgi:hypothetical protein